MHRNRIIALIKRISKISIIALLLSLAIHSLVGFYFVKVIPAHPKNEQNNRGNSDKQSEGKRPGTGSSEVDVQIVERSGKSKKPKQPKLDVGTLPVEDLSTKDAPKETTGYYGIGVYNVFAPGPFTDGFETYAYGEKIDAVVPGYPADLNGLMPGDIILSADGKRIDQGFDHIRAETDSEITLRIYRKGSFLTFRFKRAFIETIRRFP